MTAQASALRRTSYSDIVHDPMFAMGYGEIWRGEDSAIDICWEPAEQEAYERGRMFGVFVRDYEGGRVQLTKAGSIHPRCLVLLSLAMRGGSLL